MTEIVVHMPRADLDIPATSAVEKRYEVTLQELLAQDSLDVARSGILADFTSMVTIAISGTDNLIRSLYIESEEDVTSGSIFFNVRCEFERVNKNHE